MMENNLYRNNRLKRVSYIWIPYTALFIYILITMLISMFGPINYPYYTPLRKFIVFIYILCFLLVTWIGMYVSKNYKSNFINNTSDKKYQNVIKNIKSLIIISMIIKFLLVLSLILTEGLPTFGSLIRTLVFVYTKMHTEETSTNVFRQIDSLFTFISYIAIIGGLFYWKQLKKRTHFYLLITIGLDLFYKIAFLGTQRAIFTYIVYLLLIYVINVVRNKGKIRLKNLIATCLCILCIIFFLSTVVYERLLYWGTSLPVNFSSGISYNLEHILLWLIPAKFRYQTTVIMGYPTQGYYGLALCLSTPFKWTFGLGASRGINSVISQVFPNIPKMLYETYPLRAELIYDYPGLAKWHTIFPWLASDLTFFGALLYMGIVAKIFMKCWIQTIEYYNPISFVLLTLLTIQYIFVPANNQLFISRGESVATIIIFVIWLVTNEKLNFGKRAENT